MTTGLTLKQLVALRDDARLQQLTDQQWDELAHLLTHNFTFTRFKHWLKGNGIELSKGTISQNAHRLREAGERLLKRNAAIEFLRKEAAARGVTLTQAAIDQGAVAVGDLLDGSADPKSPEGQRLLLNGLSVLTGIRHAEIADKRVDQKDRELKLATDRFQFNAAKAALDQLPALRKIATDKSLDDQGKLDAARKRLFGEVPA